MAEAAGPACPLGISELAAGLTPVLLAKPTGLVLAVSGGPDSIVLMRLAARLAASQVLPPLTVATVDHGLRPTSADEAAAVVATATALGLPTRRLLWEGPKPVRAVQERARAARYALLDACCRSLGASHLLTAHTRDDQAETVLFRLLRGSGPAGLAAMRPTAPLGSGLVHARPLLRYEKARLLATCAAEGWPYVTDPSNADPRFARPRLRTLLPSLAREGLGVTALTRLADRAARAEEALALVEEDLVARALRRPEQGLVILDMTSIAPLPSEWSVRLLGRAVAGGDLDRPVRLDRLERAAEAVRAATLAGEPLVTTLHKSVLRLSADGRLAVRTEGARRRGMVPNSASREGAERDVAPSLGKGMHGPYIAP